MCTCHKEVTNLHDIHISVLTQLGSPGDTVCDFHGPLPSLLGPQLLILLVHIIAGISAVARVLLVTPLCCKQSSADDWDCLLLIGLPVELLTKLHGDIKLISVLPYHQSPTQTKLRETVQREMLLTSWNTSSESRLPGWPLPSVPFSSQSFLLLCFPLFLLDLGCGGDRRRKNKNLGGTFKPPRRSTSNPVLCPFHVIVEGLKNTNSSHPQRKDQRDSYPLA